MGRTAPAMPAANRSAQIGVAAFTSMIARVSEILTWPHAAISLASGAAMQAARRSEWLAKGVPRRSTTPSRKNLQFFNEIR
jgi:hypothetical protein